MFKCIFGSATEITKIDESNGQVETESGNGKLERKPGTETGNGRQRLLLLLYAIIVDLIELDLSPSIININKLIVIGKLITIIQRL